MKKFRRIMALLIATVMVLSMGAVAFAEGTGSIKITGVKDGHTYTAYQILKGTAKTTTEGGVEKTELTGLQWGDNVTEAFKTGKGTAAEYAETLTNEAAAKSLAKTLADGQATLLNGNSGTADATNGTATITGLADGYYLVIDTAGTGVAEEDDAFSQYIVQVVAGKEVPVTAKLDVPEFEKKVKDDDYTTDDGAQKTGVSVGVGYNDAADYDIGDDVPFELLGTLPTNYAEYTTYKYEFHDKACDGLDIKADTVKVFVDDNEVTTGFTKTVSDDKHTLDIVFANLKTAVPTATADSKVKVTFDATLNKSAVIGLDGNTNDAYLVFSNNPTDGGNGTSKTPEDEVLVFTYELDVTKVDGANTELKLKDAQFVLSKDRKFVKLDANGKVDGWLDTEPSIYADPAGENYTEAEIKAAAATGVLIADANGKFIVSGLDAGDYELKEIKAPKGYNLLSDAIAVTVKATQKNLQNYKDVDAYNEPNEVLTELKIDVTQDGKKTTGDGNTTTGIVDATVTNNSGATLPSTGGMGTTLFYLVGAVLVIGAGVMLVSRRRMQNM